LLIVGWGDTGLLAGEFDIGGHGARFVIEFGGTGENGGIR